MESFEKPKKIKKGSEDFKPGPCVEKDCSFCCNPVKVERFFPDELIPVDEDGEKIWEERNELLIPEDEIDITRLKTFDCKKFDKEHGKCLDYEHRPRICRRTSCIDKKSKESEEEQHKKMTKKRYLKIKY